MLGYGRAHLHLLVGLQLDYVLVIIKNLHFVEVPQVFLLVQEVVADFDHVVVEVQVASREHEDLAAEPSYQLLVGDLPPPKLLRLATAVLDDSRNLHDVFLLKFLTFLEHEQNHGVRHVVVATRYHVVDLRVLHENCLDREFAKTNVNLVYPQLIVLLDAHNHRVIVQCLEMEATRVAYLSEILRDLAFDNVRPVIVTKDV